MSGFKLIHINEILKLTQVSEPYVIRILSQANCVRFGRKGNYLFMEDEFLNAWRARGKTAKEPMITKNRAKKHPKCKEISNLSKNAYQIREKFLKQ